jgi:hypothetical protein
MSEFELHQALTIQEIAKTYGTAVHVAITLQPPPSPVRIHQRVPEARPARGPSLLKRTAVRFIAWFG